MIDGEAKPAELERARCCVRHEHYSECLRYYITKPCAMNGPGSAAQVPTAPQKQEDLYDKRFERREHG